MPLTITFAPPPPEYSKDSKVVLPSCSGAANGSIVIKNIKSASASIGYKLRSGDWTKQCALDADSTNPNCPVVKKGMIRNGENIELRSLAPGGYYLQIYNADWDNGNVCTTISFTIDELEQFTPLKEEFRSPTCDNESRGEIIWPVKGGKALWQIVLTPNKGNYEGNENRVIFRNLTEGRYTLELTDQCGILYSKKFTLKKPKPLEIQNIVVLPGTENIIQASGLYGSGFYSTQLIDPDGVRTSLEDNPGLIMTFTKPGVYQLQITDKKKIGCPATDTMFNIKKVPGNKTMRFKVEPVKDDAFIDLQHIPELIEYRSWYFNPYLHRNKRMIG